MNGTALAREAQETLRDIEEGIAAAARGDVVDHETVVRELRERFAGRVPDQLLREIR